MIQDIFADIKYIDYNTNPDALVQLQFHLEEFNASYGQPLDPKLTLF